MEAGKENTGQKETVLDRAVGESNETAVLVNNQRFISLIDTGSMVSTISESAYKTFRDKPVLQSLYSLGLKLTMADGSKLSYIGYIEATISLQDGKLDFDVPLLVIKDNDMNKECPVIIGTNVIRQVTARVSNGDSELPLEWKTAVSSLKLSNFVAKISGKKQVTVGPYETVSLKCMARGVKHMISQVVTENIESNSQN